VLSRPSRTKLRPRIPARLAPHERAPPLQITQISPLLHLGCVITSSYIFSFVLHPHVCLFPHLTFPTYSAVRSYLFSCIINLVLLSNTRRLVAVLSPSFNVIASEVRSNRGYSKGKPTVSTKFLLSRHSLVSFRSSRSRGPWPLPILSSPLPAESTSPSNSQGPSSIHHKKSSFRLKCSTVYKTKGLNIVRRCDEGMCPALSVCLCFCLCHSLKPWDDVSTWPVLFSWVVQSHPTRHP